MPKYLLTLILTTIIALPSQAQKTIESHMMGHSLIDHASDTYQTKIAYWIDQLADEANHNYEMTGQFGSIWNFAEFNPESNWGVVGVDRSWDGETENFADVSLNNFIFTVFNFVQDLAPDEVYFGESSSVLSASERLIDSVDLYHPEVTQYIYENWPDMAPFTGEPFDPSSSDFTAYNAFTLGDFHDWWIDLQDQLLASDPAENVRMIPVGPMIAELLSVAPYNTIPVLDLYEDNAPHGRESIYFLAGLATYMAIYEEQAPSTYDVPNTVHATLQNNYEEIVSFFWEYLISFNDSDGNSRVFTNMTSDISDADEMIQLSAFPNPVVDILNLDFTLEYQSDINIEILDELGRLSGAKYFGKLLEGKQNILLDFSNFKNGLYLVQIKKSENTLAVFMVVKGN